MARNLYVNSQGGLGFNLALAAVTPELKKKYDKVCILSPYFDVFESCESVDYVYKPEEIRDFIRDAKAENAKLICERMYDSEDFIYKKISYADAWRKACELSLHNNKDGSDTKSVLHPATRYPDLANKVIQIVQKIYEAGYEDFVIMQFEGGQSPLVQVPTGPDGKPDWSQVPTNYEAEPLKRHYPFDKAGEFIRLFHEAHPKTCVILYQLQNEHHYENAIQPEMPYLTYYELAKNPKCRGTVSIDSSLQHLVAGLTKSVVIWGHSLPNSFGYEYNKNIIQPCNRDDILYFSALGPSGARIDYIKPQELLEEVNDYLYPAPEPKKK